MTSVFISSGCCNKMTKAGWLKHQTFVPCSSGGQWIQNQGAGRLFLVRSLFLARRWSPSCCARTRQRESKLWSLLLSVKILIPSWGPTLRNSSKSNYLLWCASRKRGLWAPLSPEEKESRTLLLCFHVHFTSSPISAFTHPLISCICPLKWWWMTSSTLALNVLLNLCVELALRLDLFLSHFELPSGPRSLNLTPPWGSTLALLKSRMHWTSNQRHYQHTGQKKIF